MVMIHSEEEERTDDLCDPNSNSNSKSKWLLVIVHGAGARFFFVPTLIYNLVRNTIEPDFCWWNEIEEFLLLGAVPFRSHVLELKNVGLKAVVTLNESFETLVGTAFYEEHGIRHCVIPTKDYFYAPKLRDIRRAVKFIHEHVLKGETTYVHCKAGRGRSTTVVICYLMEYRGMNPVEAFAYVRARRPRIALARAQWKAVSQYYNWYCVKTLPAPCAASREGYNSKCECANCQEPVVINYEDLIDYKQPEQQRWIWKFVISYLLRVKSVKVVEIGCKPVQQSQEFGSIQLAAC